MNQSQRPSASRYGGQGTGQYMGQESHGSGYTGLSMRQREQMDNQNRNYNNASNTFRMNRPPSPSRDYQQYQERQYREDGHDRHMYQQQYQSNQFQRNQSPPSTHLSPLQQFRMLDNQDDLPHPDNQYFNHDSPLDWKSLSQKVYYFSNDFLFD